MAKKSNLIEELYNSLNEKHWTLISELLNREINPNKETRKNLLSKLFKKTIAISSRKSKARFLQKWVAEQISKLLKMPYGKDEEIASREMGQSGVDLRLSPRVRKLFPFSIECKNEEQWKIPAYVSQAKQNCYKDTDWLVIFTKNGYENLALLNAEVFFKILKKKK